MDEILPGLYHWTAFRETIGRTVHFAYLAGTRTLIDPMEPEEGAGWFESVAAPERILLTNRHHLRHSDRFVERYGCTVHCHEAGLHDLPDEARGFAWGQEPAPGVQALEVGALCDEETALLLDTGPGALALADALIRDEDGALGFVPDALMGEDPEGVKRGLLAAFERLLDEEFDVLVLAHGAPVVGGARDALRAFVAEEAG